MCFIVAIFILTSSVPAFANEPDSNADRKVIYKQRTEIDFEGVEVEGQLVRPNGALILDRRSANFNPLIKLRTDFDQEISESVDVIK
jgi:hypothetical protein